MKVTQTELGVEYKIWIPCEAVSDAVDDHVQQIVAITGGMTEIPVTGVWLNADGDTVQEDVHLISFITPDPAVSVMLRVVIRGPWLDGSKRRARTGPYQWKQ